MQVRSQGLKVQKVKGQDPAEAGVLGDPVRPTSHSTIARFSAFRRQPCCTPEVAATVAWCEPKGKRERERQTLLLVPHGGAVDLRLFRSLLLKDQADNRETPTTLAEF